MLVFCATCPTMALKKCVDVSVNLMSFKSALVVELNSMYELTYCCLSLLPLIAFGVKKMV